MFFLSSLVLSPRRALVGGFFLLLAAHLDAQINISSSTLTLDVTFQGGFYAGGGDDISDLLELYLGEPQPAAGISGTYDQGTLSSSILVKKSGAGSFQPPDFEFGDPLFEQGDTFRVASNAYASADPDTNDHSVLPLETYVGGYFYGDADPDGFPATLVFDVSWTWNMTLQEFPSPAGTAIASALAGFEIQGNFGNTDLNIMEIEGIELDPVDPLDTYNFGIGGGLVDGTPKELSESGTGTLYLDFDTDEGTVDIYFYTEVGAYAQMATVPEPALAWLLFLGVGLFPVLRRVRR